MSDDDVYVTYSELDAFRQCPLKHALGYKNLWTKDPEEGRPLSRGSLWHSVLEVHYRTIQATRVKVNGAFLAKPSRAKQVEILFAARMRVSQLLTDPTTGEFLNEDAELIDWMYTGHVAYYGVDLNWQILEVESADEIRLLDEHGQPTRFILKLKIDLVVRNLTLNQIELVDHKSAANFSRPAEIDIDDQFGLYAWAKTTLGMKVLRIVRSDARTQRNKAPMALEDRFQRVPTYRGERELRTIALDALNAARAAWDSERPVYSAPAPDRCTWRCDFQNAHILARKGVKIESVLKDYGFYQRDAKHREYTKQEGTG